MTRWLALTLLVACDPAASFPGDAAEVGCAHSQSCDPAAFADAFGGLETCLTRERHLMEDVAASADVLGCTFDKDEARACLDALENTPCVVFDLQDVLTGCGGAYGCVP